MSVRPINAKKLIKPIKPKKPLKPIKPIQPKNPIKIKTKMLMKPKNSTDQKLIRQKKANKSKNPVK